MLLPGHFCEITVICEADAFILGAQTFHLQAQCQNGHLGVRSLLFMEFELLQGTLLRIFVNLFAVCFFHVRLELFETIRLQVIWSLENGHLI